MSKVDAPAIEPTKKVAPPTLLRGRYMDFSPVHKPAVKKTAPAAPAPVSAPTPAPARIAKRPVPAPRDFVDGMPVAKKKIVRPVSTVPLVEPEIETEEEDGPLAEFNELGVSETEEELDEAPLEEAQEDFLNDDSSEDYVETVLSQVSETKVETTVRRSPFLKNFHIEKRPLSNHAPEREQLASTDDLAPTPRQEYKEEDFARKADTIPDNAEEPVKTKEEKTGSRLGMILTILVTILLGAGVGVFVYLAFFQ